MLKNDFFGVLSRPTKLVQNILFYRPLSNVAVRSIKLQSNYPISEEKRSFGKFLIPARFLDNLNEIGIVEPLEIQNKTLPHTLAREDMIIHAKTGTGKTLAFILPMLTHLALAKTKAKPKGSLPPATPLGIVFTPTRELARQVENEINLVGKNIFKTKLILGGDDVELNKLDVFGTCYDIVVASPGRFFTYLTKYKFNGFDLSKVQFLVLDEADTLVDIGFRKQLSKIINYLPDTCKRQTILCSATITKEVSVIAKEYLKDSFKTISVIKDTDLKIPEKIDIFKTEVLSSNEFIPMAISILKHRKQSKGIIFVNTVQSVLYYSSELKKLCSEITFAAFYGDLEQFSRNKIIKEFQTGEVQVLVATDVAARGLDTKGVEFVIQLGVAVDKERFIHRTGRTGRLASKGECFVIFTSEEREVIKSYEEYINKVFSPLENGF